MTAGDDRVKTKPAIADDILPNQRSKISPIFCTSALWRNDTTGVIETSSNSANSKKLPETIILKTSGGIFVN
ncbi:hypothetical protein K9N68_05860 [Kovacikia minuta CCNUW1]|uniref:hypothetical protein n=1 Tax=Kovacikia minuta TaxID=2931930 RepID=UPI001CD01A67|nr:hypothetical protein [Kovacikia minuta]UBF27470.1 hypothetical protein K9N68_05860 [Kovacikia minuta CCNUW1]